MKIRFTPEWHLEVLLENPLEHEIWPCLVNDARCLGEDSLSDSLGPDFEDESFENWQEWIQPEVEACFQEQLRSIQKFTKKIEDNVFFVPNKQVFSWYGAINQARFALESIFQFSRDEIPSDPEERDLFIENWPLEKQASYQRYSFYSWFQEVILENMMAQASPPEPAPPVVGQSTTANSSSLPLPTKGLPPTSEKEIPLPPAPQSQEKKEPKASKATKAPKSSKDTLLNPEAKTSTPATPPQKTPRPSEKKKETKKTQSPESASSKDKPKDTTKGQKTPPAPKKKKPSKDDDDYTQPDLF